MNQDSSKPQNNNKSTPAAKAARKPRGSHAMQGGTPQANRLAVAILEVLAGECTPAEAATSLEISLVRYFQLEARALDGMVAALEPRPRGKQPSLDKQVKQLEKQLKRARSECTRQQALVRITQRSLGLPVRAATNSKKAPARDRTGRKKRVPMVRALRAARALRARSQQQEHSVAASADVTVEPSGAEKPRPDSIAAVQLSPIPAETQDVRPQEVETVND